MRVGVDATSWFNGRGYGRYTRELLPRLVAVGAAHEWLVYVEAMNADRLSIDGATIRPVPCSVAPSEAASSTGARSIRDLLRFRRSVKADRPDVFFVPTVYSFFPLPRRQRTVIGVHDAIAERFPELCFANGRARLFWNLKVKWALRQATLVLTVSDFARDDLVRHLGVSADRIRVAVEAPSDAYRETVPDGAIATAAKDVGLPDGARWFTYVGGFSPHKNLDILLRAHARLDDDSYVVMAGTLGGDSFHDCLERLRELVKELGTGDRVLWPGFVPDDALRALHAGSVACLLPSACEGFGLPAVEAAACGAAVVATTESPLPQLLEGGGIFVEPGDVDALVDAMGRVDDDGLRAVARERANALTWDATASRVLQIIEEAVA